MRTLLGVCIALAFAQDEAKDTPVELPAKLVADRFYVHPVTQDGAALKLITDSGGGMFITAKAADRLKLERRKVPADGTEMEVVVLPPFKPEASIPLPDMLNGALPVLPASQEGELPEEVDGLLGQAWFRGRTWTFDYPAAKLLWHPKGGLPEAGTRVKLGFSTDVAGRRRSNFPRITIQIDGGDIDMLFDTGATMKLSDKALKEIGQGGPAARAASFIARSTFDKWRAKHPEWRVIEGGDTTAGGHPIIEVSKVTIAGSEVGPAWFAARPDKNFGEYMSQWMDRRIDGAVGGTILRHFRITVDYVGATAVFERAQ